MKLWRSCLLLAVTILLASCAKPASSDADIRKALEEHLASRPGLASAEIVMDVKKVEVNGDKADADVVFHSRNDANAQMNFHYQLHREGNQWKVEQGRPAGAAGGSPTPHPGGALPGEAPAGSPQPLPEGHPQVGDKE